MACLGNAATLSVIDDDLVRHQLRSQEAEEMLHFMEGKYQIDAYALTPEDQNLLKKFSIFCSGHGRPSQAAPWAGHSKR